MATIQSTLSLQDKMSSTLSKIQKNALKNIQTFNKMSDEVNSFQKALEKAESADPEIINTAMYNDAVEAMEAMRGKMYDVIHGEEDFEDEDNNLKQSITETNQALELLGKAWNLVSKAMQEANEWMQMSNNQFNQEFTSAVKLHNVLGASKEEIQSMYDYASALQEVGVVGDEAVLAGVSELAIYADNYDQVKKLIPGILDLAVANEGLNVSQSSVESTAQLIGRALNGNAKMLQKQLGLSENEVKALDNMSDKTKKAAKLYEYLERTGNNANEMLAQMPQGGIMQAQNSLGDLQEQLGTKVIPYFEMFNKMLVQILTPIVDFVTANSDWLIPSIIVLGGALSSFITILTIYKTAMLLASFSNWAFVAPLLIIVGILGIIIGVVALSNKVVESTGGNTLSIIGTIMGTLNVMKTFVANIFIDLYNILMGITHGIALLFIGLAEIVIGVINGIASAIDFVFGTNLAEGTSNLMKKLDATGQNILKGEDFADRLDYNDAFEQGYNYGESMFNPIESENPFDIDKYFNSIVGKDSTGATAIKTTSNDNLLSDDDIQLLLDVATRDYQLNYQQVTPNITVSFGDVRETVDVDSVMDAVATGIEEIINGDGEIANG